MHRPTKLKMSDLNPHLACVLCDGYFVDATTIVECLHSFCRACIVKYLETNKYCPICDVQVHKTKPLLSIRSDKTLQDVVYKLVPRLYQDEMKKRVEFYSEHPEEAARCTSEERGEGAKQRFIYTPDETISLSLEYGTGETKEEPVVKTGDNEGSEEMVPAKRYLQCPAAITVGHLKKFISAKFAVPSSFQVDISYTGDVLNEDYTLMDVAYIFAWRRSGPMRLFYQIKSRPIKRRKISHAVPEVKPVIPIIKEPEMKKPANEYPTLRLLPSPSAVANEFKFVLKTVSPKKEQNVTEPINQRLLPANEQRTVPSVVNSDPPQSSSANLKIAEVPLLLTPARSKTVARENSTTNESVACSQTLPSQIVVTMTSSDSKTSVFPSTAVTQATPLLQPILCSTYRAPAVTKPQTGSKRPTRSRVKNRSNQRPPLVRLAPYPPPARTNSPTTNTLVPQVNHFPNTPVTCFTAPSANCLSTAPVNCLGAVSVNYLPSASVACFEPSSMNTTTAVNVNNLMASSVSNLPITTSFSRLPSENPCVQVSVATTPNTAVNDNLTCSKTHTASSAITSSVATASKNNVTVPVITVSSQSFVGTTSTTIGRSAQGTSVPVIPLNTHSMPATIPLAPKLTITKSRENMVLKSAVAAENKPIMFSGASKSNTIQANDSQVLPNTSAGPSVSNKTAGLAPSMPVISMDVSSSTNSTTSIPSAMINNIVVKPVPSASFSVNSLLPNGIATTTNSASNISHMSVTSQALPLSIPKSLNSSQLPNSISLPVKETSSTPKSNRTEQSRLDSKPSLQLNNIETSLSTSPVSTEKNSINTPFKEVKSSIITAEFSDNDDLGCQPDLVVDEQKMDSSDNEDEAEEALRRKIAAIAEKDDEVELDNETDSGRASDVSNQARSSCDDEIGSPLPRPTDSERLTRTTNNTPPLSVNFLPATSPAVPTTPTKLEEPLPLPSKHNGIDRIIKNLHRNHERKDNIGALDLSTTSCRKPGDQSPRPRARQVANPPVLDAKHRQQTCLSAPTKQHTACVPAPKHPTSSSFPIRNLSASRHGIMSVPIVENSMPKVPPVTIPHFSPKQMINAFPGKTPQALSTAHFCRTPQIPIHSNANQFHTTKSNVSSRQSKSNSSHSRSANLLSPSARKSPSVTNGRKESASPRHNNVSSPSTPISPHHRLSPCVTPPKSMSSLPITSGSAVQLSVPSTSSYKVARAQIPIYKKSDSYKNSPHHNRFKGSNLTVINPDPNGYSQRIVIKNLDCLPNNHNNNHRFVK